MTAKFRNIGRTDSGRHHRRAACFGTVDNRLSLTIWETSAPSDKDQLLNGDYCENFCETFDKSEMRNFIGILAEAYERQWGVAWDK
jgi:hypothetical protein